MSRCLRRIPLQATLAILSLAAAGATAEGQARTLGKACDPTTSTSIEFGHTGGNLRPTGSHIASNGIITRLPDGTAAGAIPRAAVSALARLAWSKEFVALPEAPTRPTRNPDVTRDFIEVTSGCGQKHVEYPSGQGAPVFRQLYALLSAVTR